MTISFCESQNCRALEGRMFGGLGGRKRPLLLITVLRRQIALMTVLSRAQAVRLVLVVNYEGREHRVAWTQASSCHSGRTKGVKILYRNWLHISDIPQLNPQRFQSARTTLYIFHLASFSVWILINGLHDASAGFLTRFVIVSTCCDTSKRTFVCLRRWDHTSAGGSPCLFAVGRFLHIRSWYFLPCSFYITEEVPSLSFCYAHYQTTTTDKRLSLSYFGHFIRQNAHFSLRISWWHSFRNIK